jgi:arsenate reductase
MSLKVYEYKNCSTCQKAIKWLEKKNKKFQALPIVDQPPTKTELETMLGYLKNSGGSIKNLFNTSGVHYREQKIADKLKAGMSEAVALDLLSKNGKLIKRPFILGKDQGAVGFNDEVWSKLF